MGGEMGGGGAAAGLSRAQRKARAKEARRIALHRDENGWMLCPYCDQRAELVPLAEVYGGRDFGKPHERVYRCLPCNARVGCHPGTCKALGNLANEDTRRARLAAHAAFDRLWKAKMERDRCSKNEARGKAYKWLAAQLEIDPLYCHIGWMDTEACEEVVRICMAIRLKGEDR